MLTAKIDSHMHSNVSPITDACDNFAATDFKQSTDQLINGLIFPGDSTLKAEYNDGKALSGRIGRRKFLAFHLFLDIAQRLNVLEHMVNTGGLSPENLSLNITSEQQLADINAWLARLSGSIPDNYAPTTMTMDSYGQAANCMPAQDTCTNATAAAAVAASSYASDLMLQSYTDVPHAYPSESKLYPVSPEQDMYVRSYPVTAAPPAPSSTLGYNATTPSNIYGDFSCASNGYPPVDDSLSHFGYFGSQYQPMDTSMPAAMDTDGITGVRHHYSVVPGITSTPGFAPDIRTAMNYMSENNRHKRVPAKNPVDTDVKKQDAGETVVPTRATVSAHEDKKSMATLSNVFASPSGEKPNKPETKKVQEEHKVVSKEKKRSSVKKDVMELLVNDIESLNLQERTSAKAAPTMTDEDSQTTTLYPSTTSLPEKETNEHKPQASTTTTTRRRNSKSVAKRHRELLQQLQKWVNDSYVRSRQKDNDGAAASDSPKATHSPSISVPVQ